MLALIAGLWGRVFAFNPLRSFTWLGLVGVILAYVASHFDPSAFTPTGLAFWGVVSSVIGVTGIRNWMQRVLDAVRQSAPPMPIGSTTRPDSRSSPPPPPPSRW